jgi:uncharacterized protein YdeI (BOF family)
MSKIIIILSMFLASMVFISGCIDDKNNKDPETNETIISEQIPTANLPPGFTFMTVDETTENINNFPREAIEGIYRSDGNDAYVYIFKNETPEVLIEEYKSEYKDANYNPFTEISINGHNATQVKYPVTDGTQIMKYYIIWTTKNSMIKVGGLPDPDKVKDLAEAIKS